jgi:hypothetical protein
MPTNNTEKYVQGQVLYNLKWRHISLERYRLGSHISIILNFGPNNIQIVRLENSNSLSKIASNTSKLFMEFVIA